MELSEMKQATGGGGVIELIHSKENSKLKAGQWGPTSFLINNTMPGQYDAARQDETERHRLPQDSDIPHIHIDHCGNQFEQMKPTYDGDGLQNLIQAYL